LTGKAGATNFISMAASGVTGDNGLTALGTTSTTSSTETSTGSGAWTQTQAAQNSLFTIDGTTVSTASNAPSTAITGVTLNLTADAVGTTQTLSISPNTTSQATAITNFVNLYNTLVTTMNTLASYTPASSSSSGASSHGPLLGDSTLNSIRNTLSTIVSGVVKSGGLSTSLSSIGITLQADGTLKTDSTALSTALQSNPATVAAIFNSTTGIAAKLNNNITSVTQTGGVIDVRTTAINKDLSSITTQQTALSDYAKQLTTQYQAQFTALNTLMPQMNNNAQYLTQLFGGTNSAGAMATNK
jgi:flagellar hook-associated protein 2